jgi:AbrB family looped-hinge helix DNA binding protein
MTSPSRYTTQVDARGRLVLPAEVRRRLRVGPGDVLVLDLDEDAATLWMRTGREIARSARGVFRDRAADRDLTAELLADRRTKTER